MMNMTFHFSDRISHLLFYSWEIKSVEDMVLVVFVVFLTAVGLELLKLFYAKLGQTRRKNPLYALQDTTQNRRSGPINHPSSSQHQSSPLLASLRIPSSVSKIKRRRLKLHVVESFLHTVQVALGYILMLVVMTYNAYLLITVILALTISYFFLAPLRQMREPVKVPARHRSLTDSDQRTGSSAQIVESAEAVRNPYYGSLYQ